MSACSGHHSLDRTELKFPKQRTYTERVTERSFGKGKGLGAASCPTLGLSLIGRIPGRPRGSPRPLGAAGTCPGDVGRLRLLRAGGDSPRSVRAPGLELFVLPPHWSSSQSPIASASVQPLPSLVRAAAAPRSECTDGISSWLRVKVPRPSGPKGARGARLTLRCLARMRQRDV